MTEDQIERNRLDYLYRKYRRAERIGRLVVPVVRLLHRLGLVSQHRLYTWTDHLSECRYAREEFGICRGRVG